MVYFVRKRVGKWQRMEKRTDKKREGVISRGTAAGMQPERKEQRAKIAV